MSDKHEWRFEPCSPEGVRDPMTNQPWEHAAKGVRPKGQSTAAGRAVVYGYGHTEDQAIDKAKSEATIYDARETIGQRGEPVYYPPPPPHLMPH